MSKSNIYNILFFLIIFYQFDSNNAYLQIVQTDKKQEYVNYYSFLFYDEHSKEFPQEEIQLPGIYPQMNYDLKTNFLSFEKEFTLKYPNANTKIIFEKGFNDQGMLMINDEFIDVNIIQGNEGYLHTIPPGVLKEGFNKITLLVIFHSLQWNFEGDIYLENGLEKIYLNGFWDHKVHKNLENNFQRKPTQGLDVLSFIDLDLDLNKYILDINMDTDWSTTNLPITIESLYDDKYLNGMICFRKKILFETSPEEDFILNIENGIDDYDRFYVNGFLIGSTDCFSCERNYRIPKEYLKQENIFTFLIIDKNGPGGIFSPILLKSKSNSIDISSKWSYKKLLELQMLITIKNSFDNNSIFSESEFKFYDLFGNQLSFNSLLVKENRSNTISILILTSVVLFIILLLLLIRSNRKKNIPKGKTIKKDTKQKFIFIRADRADHKILLDDILSVEGKKDYVKIQLDSKSYLVRKNLKTFLLDLPSSKFVRISKSVAINLEKISTIQKNIIFLNSGKYHVISKNYVGDINDLTLR